MANRKHLTVRRARQAIGLRPLHITRSVWCRALAHGIDAAGCSRATAAGWFEVSPITLRRWLGSERAIRVENVMRSRRVWSHVLRFLNKYERLDSKAHGGAR